MPFLKYQRTRTEQPRHIVPLAEEYKRVSRFVAVPGMPGFFDLGNSGKFQYPPNGLLLRARNPAARNNGIGQVSTSGSDTVTFERATSLGSDAYIEIDPDQDWTFIGQVDNASFFGGNDGFWRSGGGGGTTFVIYEGTTRLWVRQNGSDFFGTSGRPAAGSSITVVVSCKSGQRVTAAQNGMLEIDSSTAATTGNCTGTDGINFFGLQGASEWIGGSWTLLGFFNRYFPPDVCRSLSRNPWQIFEPETYDLYWTAAGGGGVVGPLTRSRLLTNGMLIDGRLAA